MDRHHPEHLEVQADLYLPAVRAVPVDRSCPLPLSDLSVRDAPGIRKIRAVLVLLLDPLVRRDLSVREGKQDWGTGIFYKKYIFHNRESEN